MTRSKKESTTPPAIADLFELLGQRWTLRILWELRDDALSSRSLAARCGGISPSVLHHRLAALRTALLVVRRPPDGYALTNDGAALAAAMAGLEEWAVARAERERAHNRAVVVSSPGVSSLLLIVPEKADPERDLVADAWRDAKGSVLSLTRFWDPPEVDPALVRVYGNDTFCLVLAQKLALDLVSPDDLHLVKAPREIVKRRVHSATVDSLLDITQERFPAFVKPVMPKQFPSRVYASAEELSQATHGLTTGSQAVVSEIVAFTAEVRAFVLDGEVMTCAFYEGSGDLAAAASFATDAARAMDLPRTCVVDVGLAGGEWMLVECNATWGAGLNGCDATRVVSCIAAASGPAPSA